jgi:preprotein translocase subunit SecA
MQNKGNRIKFCETNEVFNQIIQLDNDNGLRNAIGHGSYSYDGVTQIIKYFSSGKIQKGEEEQIYLVEFIQKTWFQFQTLIILIEIIYQTRKKYYVQHGTIPISQEGFIREKKEKIGRNAPCPCGSGKKYKKCCGSNN